MQAVGTELDNPEQSIEQSFRRIRAVSVAISEPLELEDYVVQSMPDASPIKWHLAHTSWFFEQFVLKGHVPGYRPFHPQFEFLFNSYYQSVGPMHRRAERGMLTRPTVAEVMRYRAHVDEHMRTLLTSRPRDLDTHPPAKRLGRPGALDTHSQQPGELDIHALVTLGLNHEQQHQELMLTDLKHLFSCNPLLPAYRPGSGEMDVQLLERQRLVRARHSGVQNSVGVQNAAPLQQVGVQASGAQGSTKGSSHQMGVQGLGRSQVGVQGSGGMRFRAFDGGLREIGAAGAAFFFDNEGPRHRVVVEPYALADRPVTNGDFLEFVRDGGYRRPELWLSDGWATVLAEGWDRPWYWSASLDSEFSLAGLVPLDWAAPACHLSYYEADAFARWAGARLPTEAEWELAAATMPVAGNFLDSGSLHPTPSNARGLRQIFGDVWEWTASSYSPYPGYRPPAGALGEYNGKFMCSQLVLRGGSCATPADHVRATYRNFFYPQARWQFSGARLARDLHGNRT